MRAHTVSYVLTFSAGNKIDLVEKRTRHYTKFSEQAKFWGVTNIIALNAAENVSYMVTSALTGEGCDTLKEKIIFMLPDTPPVVGSEEDYRHWCSVM